MECKICQGPCKGHPHAMSNFDSVIIPDYVNLVEGAKYTVLKCSGCRIHLLINYKNYPFDSKFVCTECSKKTTQPIPAKG